MEVAIIKYNAGNICSVDNALRRLGIEPIITSDAEQIRKADHVIFPGQGEAGSTMMYLKEHRLDQLITDLKQPVLGICIGMQLMCKHSEEGNTDCLGIFDTNVKRFTPDAQTIKVPQMGWNTITDTRSELFKGIPTDYSHNGTYVYFIHSYYVPLCPWTIATTDYIQPYSSALHKDNFFATQFHPEKSGDIGEKIIKNFLDIQV